MAESLVPIFVVVVFVGAIGLAVWRFVRERKRREGLETMAAERGWAFTPRDDAVAMQLRDTFSLFRAGDRKRQCRNVVRLTGRTGEQTVFDYRYDTVSRDKDGKSSSQTHHFGVVLSRLPAWLPELELSSEDMFTKIGSVAGFRGIEVESAQFNKRFRVRAKDRTHAFDILHPQVIEFLLAQELDEWHIADGWLLVSRSKRWKLEDYETVPGTVDSFVELVPDYVWSKHAPDTAG